MKLIDAVVESICLPLSQPLDVGGESLQTRSGLRLHVRGGQGHSGFGDVCPLPGFSGESLDEALGQVHEVLPLLTNCEIHDLPWETMLPSVRCGVEMAIQDLVWQEQGGEACWQGKSVALNTLLFAEQEDVWDQARSRFDEGYRSFKLKLGRQGLEEDIAVIRELRDLLGPDVLLRLDVNGRWSLEEAVRFGLAVGAEGIAYVEEPVAHVEQYGAFYEQTGLPLALDMRNPEGYVALEGVTTWVLKPMLLGGVSVCQEICERARVLGLQVVLSSLFESAHVLRFYGRLAVMLGLEDVSHGLDTWRWLAGSNEALTIDQGRLELGV